MKIRNRMRGVESGFTLLETLLAVAVLMIVVAATFTQINKAQANYRVEGQKLDFTQEQGQFLDQFARDLHQAGFPNVFSLGANSANAAAGLTSLTSTSLTMEGDLDGTGIQTVNYYYCDGVVVACPAQASCPCIVRSAVPKGQPAAPFVAVQNVQPPANGIFTPYGVNANQAAVPLTFPVASLKTVKSIAVSFTVQGGTDVNGKTQIQTTMAGMARLPNN